jgi:chorismate mutase-like protein
MSIRHALLAAAGLLLAGVLPATAQTADGARGVTPRVLRVGSTGDYPPFTYRDPASGRFIGSDIDLAQSLADRLGWRLDVVQTSWKTLADDLQAGRFELALGGVSITPERSRIGRFSRPYLQDGKAPIVRCADVRRFQSVADINRPSVRVIVNVGGTNERFARAKLPQSSLSVVPSNLTVFDAVLAGRADVMVTDAIETRLQQQLRPGLCAVHPDRPFEPSAKAIFLSAQSTLLPEVNRWLAEEIGKGHVRQGIDRWLRYPWPLGPTAAQALATLVDERLLLMPDVARYKWNRKQAIEDPPRERALLDAIREQAPRYGLDPARAAAFFAAQIEASKLLQRELFFAWQANGQGDFAVVKDLAAEIRPRLDALNPQLLAALAAVDGTVDRQSFGPLASTALSAAAVQAALEPLLPRNLP